MCHRDRREQGITIIELMVVVSIIGILAGMSYLGMDFIRKERVNGAARQLLSDIQKIRVDALTTSPTATTALGYGISFTAGSPGSYTAFIFNDENGDFAYETGEELQASTTTLSSSLSLSLLSSANAAYRILVYNKLGFPTRYKTDGNSLSLSSEAMNIVLTDVSSNIKKCVTIMENSIREGVVSGSTCVQQ